MHECLLYGLLWVGFGLGHSLLSAHAIKTKLVGFFGKTYRLFFNVVSVIHFWTVIRYGSAHLSRAHFSFFEPLPLDWGMSLLTTAGVGLVVSSLLHYDLREFVGLSQLRSNAGEFSTDTLRTDGLLAWVRHPMYLGLLLALWGQAVSVYGLFTAVWATLYLLIGVLFEEKKLVAVFGKEYLDYQKSVSTLFPIKKLFFRSS